jgi:glycosyltransferase involved in cell wall biosynthesis
MHVTIVSRIYRPEPSAASLFLGSVADALTGSGHEVEVLTARAPRQHPSPARRERVRGFPVMRDKSGYVRGYLSYLSFDLPLALRLLFARRPDVLLVEPPPTTGAVVRVVCALRRIPYVYDAADIWSDAANMATSNRVVIRLLQVVERFAMNGARHLVSISDGVLSRAAELGVRTSGTVIGFGADTETFAFTPVPPERLFIYAGSYANWHGAELIVDAFAEFLSTHRGYRLRIIGNGTELPLLTRRASELGIDGAVEFRSPVSPAELLPQLSSAVASLATLRPGEQYQYAFATKIYSSLAAGCPTIFAGPGPTGPFLRRASAEVPAGIACSYSATEVAGAMRTLADAPVDESGRRSIAEWTRENHSLLAVGERVVQALRHAATRQKRA